MAACTVLLWCIPGHLAAQEGPQFEPPLGQSPVSEEMIRRYESIAVSPRGENSEDVRRIIEAVRTNELLYSRFEIAYRINTFSYEYGPLASLPATAWGAKDELGNPVRAMTASGRWLIDGDRERVSRRDEAKYVRKDDGGGEGKPFPLVTTYEICFDGEQTKVLSDSDYREGTSDAVTNTREGRGYHDFTLYPHRMLYGTADDLKMSQFLDGFHRDGARAIVKRTFPGELRYLGKKTISGLECEGIADQWWKNDRLRSETRFWFAVDRNYLPVLRESWLPGKHPFGPRNWAAVEEFRELEPGVWLPWSCKKVQLEGGPLAKGTVTPSFTRTIQVSEASLDPDPAAMDCESLQFPDDAAWYRVRDGEIVEKDVPGTPDLSFERVEGRRNGAVNWWMIAGFAALGVAMVVAFRRFRA